MKYEDINDINETAVIIKNGGYLSDVFLILQEYLGFNLKISELSFGGLKLRNSWIGRIGFIQRNESDLALPLGITYDKLEAIDYSDVIDVSRVRFFTSKPNELSKMLAVIFPFGLWIWIALMITFILTGLCFYLILNWNSRRNETKHVKLYDIFWAIFGSFSNKGSSLFEVSGYCRIMVFGWLIAMFIIVSSYSGALMSFLAFTGYEYVPETFPELIKEMKNGHYTASYIYNMDLVERIKLATQETPLILALKKLRTEDKLMNWMDCCT
ncbi:glutamate receptor ionotropic, delta-2-like [Centruroides sculpturatus]|uniref:glutamate receptor ionotropic, delta-2-like n=1 Tax=Centruroides sculpturatus TaxID=218467 RepID=UPI000C6DE32B|nr:glutamate receptor ionotropic, delta-2-like [Centruroides sculpturatus]